METLERIAAIGVLIDMFLTICLLFLESLVIEMVGGAL